MNSSSIASPCLSEKETERYFGVLNAQLKFAEQFDYNEKSDRALAIVGPAFLDFMLGSILSEFLVDDEKDEKEVRRLLQPEGPLSTYGNRVTACFCLGLIGNIVKSDLRLIAKSEIVSHMTYTQIFPTPRSAIGAKHSVGIENSLRSLQPTRQIAIFSKWESIDSHRTSRTSWASRDLATMRWSWNTLV